MEIDLGDSYDVKYIKYYGYSEDKINKDYQHPLNSYATFKLLNS